jgi:hypothetical protein
LVVRRLLSGTGAHVDMERVDVIWPIAVSAA